MKSCRLSFQEQDLTEELTIFASPRIFVVSWGFTFRFTTGEFSKQEESMLSRNKYTSRNDHGFHGPS